MDGRGDDIRRKARACHAADLAGSGGDRTAAALVGAAARAADIEVEAFMPGTRFAAGVHGCFERIGSLISIASTLDPDERDLVIAHEFGHSILHSDAVSDTRVVLPPLVGDDSSGAMVGCSPKQRI